MELPKSLKVEAGAMALSMAERNRASILVVESDANDCNLMRFVLKNLGMVPLQMSQTTQQP